MEIDRRILPAFAMLLGMFVSTLGQAAESVRIENVWIRAAPPSATSLAGYGVIVNRTGARQTLISVTSPDFRAVEFHTTILNHGYARMEHLKTIDIPNGGEIRFQTGGYHLMLIDPKRRLKEGDEPTLIFHFANQAHISIKAPLRRSE